MGVPMSVTSTSAASFACGWRSRISMAPTPPNPPAPTTFTLTMEPPSETEQRGGQAAAAGNGAQYEQASLLCQELWSRTGLKKAAPCSNGRCAPPATSPARAALLERKRQQAPSEQQPSEAQRPHHV